jgi:redox-sensitive bicupin YhaK (pirin superfamily)
MKSILHTADSRGLADHGWLTSRHTFSFAGYHDPERVQFGLLRVLNDDIVKAGKGFGMHPHDNMEIISIPLQGALEHKDSMGTGSVIRTHDVQIMSAGTGVYHSEFNHSHTDSVNFLQIWIFPKERNIEPRYQQMTFLPESMHNRFQLVVSPKKDNSSLWINQDAYISLGNFDNDRNIHYTFYREGNGLYLFLIDGEVDIGDDKLRTRDGIGIWDTNGLSMHFRKDSRVLLLEVPMH